MNKYRMLVAATVLGLFVAGLSVLVDFICIAMLAWVFSGLFMWWKQPRLRVWGTIAVTTGLISFPDLDLETLTLAMFYRGRFVDSGKPVAA